MFIQQIINRCNLLGIEFVPFLFLLADVFLLLNITAFVLRVIKLEKRPPVETFLAVGLTFLACVVSTVTLLGAIGILSWTNLLLFHFLIWLGLPLVRYQENYGESLRETWRSLLDLAKTISRPIAGLFQPKNWRKEKKLEQGVLFLIVLLLTFFAILATFSLPLNYDSNTYRLSRIGYWLQEKNVYHFVTNDERHNYMAQNADLVMLWITSFFRRGFPLVHLAQFFAGLLSCGAVFELGRALRFSRLCRLSAVIVLLGIPNVAMQFFTSQTDLFTTGTLAAGLFFLLQALRNHRLPDWFLFAAGLGLAVGAKGTVFYWGPGLLLLLICWAWIYRTPWKKLVKGMALTALVAFLLGGFNYVQNLLDYGNPFAPPATVRNTYSSLTTFRSHRALANGTAYLWQIFEPNSNPPFLRPLTDLVLDRIETLLKTADLDGFPQESFKAATGWVQFRYIDDPYAVSEDLASFGLSTFFFGIGGGLVSIFLLFKSRQIHTMQTATIFVSVLLFLVVFCFLQKWTVHKYRYFVLLGPFLSVLCIFPLMNLATKGQKVVYVLFLCTQIFMASHVAYHGRSHGFFALMNPKAASNYHLWDEETRLFTYLGGKPLNIAIALPEGCWLAPYFRPSVNHHYSFVRLSELQKYDNGEAFFAANGYDLLITVPKKFKGGLGRVHAFTSPSQSQIALRPVNIL